MEIKYKVLQTVVKDTLLLKLGKKKNLAELTVLLLCGMQNKRVMN